MESRATKALVWGGRDGPSAVDKLVLATVNAPYRRSISAATLAECVENAALDDRFHESGFSW